MAKNEANTSAQSLTMLGPELNSNLRGEINKRLSLNLLIQGAACHTFVTSHHLVREQLENLKPGLVHQYDRFAAALYYLEWFTPDVIGITTTDWFWSTIACDDHIFHNHRFLAKYGMDLAYRSFNHINKRVIRFDVCPDPRTFPIEEQDFVNSFFLIEKKHRHELEQLAKDIVVEIWGIDESILSAQITRQPAFGNIREPETEEGKFMLPQAIGWGGVVTTDSGLQVVAKAIFWPLVVHELVKATAELVCLHGLNQLDEATYTEVIKATDHLEFEVWMMQVGPELYRLLLKALPPGMTIADGLMHVALLAPADVETFLFDLVEANHVARCKLVELASNFSDESQ